MLTEPLSSALKTEFRLSKMQIRNKVVQVYMAIDTTVHHTNVYTQHKHTYMAPYAHSNIHISTLYLVLSLCQINQSGYT